MILLSQSLTQIPPDFMNNGSTSKKPKLSKQTAKKMEHYLNENHNTIHKGEHGQHGQKIISLVLRDWS